MNKKGKEKSRLEITEMFAARATRDHYFFGIISRFEDQDGNPYVFSKISMPNNGYICSQSTDQKELSKNLDEMCVMILRRGLHNDAGVSTIIAGTSFFLN
jgi:hypothetical protein